MAVNAVLLSDFLDARFCAAFRMYFDEIGVHVSDWDSLFREMNEEGTNRAYVLLDGKSGTLGFLQFQITDFASWFFEERVGFIREFWVAPAYRRRGYGRSLLRLAEAYFVEHGAYRSILTSDAAAAFYLANGYVKAAGIKAKNRMEVLVKKLPESAQLPCSSPTGGQT